MRQPRQLSKAERFAQSLHLKILNEQTRATAIERNAHLRRVLTLPRLGRNVTEALHRARVFSDGTSIRDEP